ncbi:MAG TPA: DUF6184 family natural product biosynthesis lipoprotein [Polyangiaceae bacterium]|jgi:hypothetical protein
MRNHIEVAASLASAALGIMLTCCASSSHDVARTQPIVPETETSPTGVTSQQALADEDVVERLSAARCDRSQSCNRIGPGAAYRDRDDCMAQMGVLVAKELNASRCPGGIGEVGVSKCVHSLHVGECDMPGMEYTTAAHCKLNDMCLR